MGKDKSTSKSKSGGQPNQPNQPADQTNQVNQANQKKDNSAPAAGGKEKNKKRK